MLFARLDSVSAHILRFFRNSRWLTRFCEPPSETLCGALKGLTETPSEASAHRPTWQRRLRERTLLGQKRSPWRRLYRTLWTWFAESAVGAIGVFLLTLGGISLLQTWVMAGARFSLRDVLLPLGLLLAAIPLLHSTVSVSFAIRSSLLLRGFLLDFCGLEEGLLGERDEGLERRGVSLLLGCVCGGLTLLVPLPWLLLLLLVPLLLALFFSVPEVTVFFSWSLFPLLELTPRPTLSLLLILTLSNLACLGKMLSGKRQATFGVTDCLALLLALFFGLGGMVAAGDATDGLTRAYLLLSAWFPIRGLLTGRGWLTKCMGGLMLSAFFTAAFGVWQYVAGEAEGGWLDLSRFSDIPGRVCSFFENPNLLAVLLLLVLPLFLGGCRVFLGFGARVLSGVGFAVGAVCLLLTWSRGAWLGFLVSLFLFLLLSGERGVSILLVSPLPLWAGLPYLPRSVSNRFLSIGQITESSSRYRFYTWKGSLRMLSAHPFGIGCGEDSFHLVYPFHAVPGTERVMHAHSQPLQLLVETGLPSVVAVVLLLWRLARRCGGLLRRQDDPRRPFCLSFLCGIAGGMVMGLFDCVWYHFGLFWLFWCFCAVCMNLSEGEEGR